MAVVTRKRKSGKSYYVTYEYDGKKIWEPAGTDVREAKRLNRRRLEELADGTYDPGARTASKSPTVREYAEGWLARRTNRTAEQDDGRMRRHVLSLEWFAGMRLGDLEPRHMIRLVQELQSRRHECEDRPIGGAYAKNIYVVVRTMCRDARIAGHIKSDPCVLPRGLLVNKGKRRQPYSLEAVARLFACAALHPSARVFAALLLLTGMREGEVCGRRWRDWDRAARPLGSLSVATQYDDQRLKTDKGEAGEHSRKVPVHPVLADVLSWWWESGFELVHRRKPTERDFIVPSEALSCHSQRTAYHLWRCALKKANVANLSLHSTRHTFISMCRRGGARPDVLEVVTHNAKGTIIDEYTHWEWEPLCEAVLCLRLTPREPPPAAAPPAAGDVRWVPQEPPSFAPSGDAAGDDCAQLAKIQASEGCQALPGSRETPHTFPESPWIWSGADPSRKTAVEGGVTAECAARHHESDSRNERWLREAVNALYEGLSKRESLCVG